MSRLDLTPVFRTAVGFDRMANLVDSMIAGGIDNQSNWPPYNIEKQGDNAYRISMAVAGFGEDELDIEQRGGALIVRGTAGNDAPADYLYRGIAARNFERRFQLADHVKVTGAHLDKGLLHIALERVIPDAMKPRNIAINNTDAAKSKPKIVSGKAS